MYDLLIKGGRVIDPAEAIDAHLDIGINGGKLASVARDIPSAQSRQVIEASDKIVTPGLIDMHCHVYAGVWEMGTEPDDAGVKQGVTTVVDGGSAGHAVFGGFPKYVIPASRTTIFCFIHLGSRGLVVLPNEIRDWEEIDLDATAKTIESNLGLIRGVKLRLVGEFVISNAIELVKMAKKVAADFRLPTMIHIGDPESRAPARLTSLTQSLLSLMEPGEILSHVYTAKPGKVCLPDGTFIPELKEAAERGIILDVAHGRNNFSFEIARRAMDQGIFPTTLSTDVVVPSLSETVYGLTVTMSKFMALGVELNRLIAMTTINPARALGIQDRKGSLKVGMDADISILEISSGTWKLQDAERETLEATKLIAPSMTIKAGHPVQPQPVAQPPRK